jgi:hypothetical protein
MLRAIRVAFEATGGEFIAEKGGGAGVRFRKADSKAASIPLEDLNAANDEQRWRLGLKFEALDGRSRRGNLPAMLGENRRGCAMTTINDLIEDWIQMRATLQRQLKALEAGQITTGDAIVGSTTEDTIIRVKKWINELNTLLKEYTNAAQT